MTKKLDALDEDIAEKRGQQEKASRVEGVSQESQGIADRECPEVSFITLNCWGLKYVSKFREKRMREIGERLANQSNDYDIIALQECWVYSDFVYIQECLKPSHPYSKFFFSGILAGPGLAIFSKFPIFSASLFRYPINGRPSAFFRGDWYVGKSVASVLIRHPCGRVIEVFNTHMHAPYGPGDASYICHRTTQAWELSRLLKSSVERGHVTIAVGDFNSRPDSVAYRLITKLGGLKDSWVSVHGEASMQLNRYQMGQLSAVEQITQAGTTCDSLLNTWRQGRRPDEACRLDYVFYNPHAAKVHDISVVFTQPIPGIGSCSDHFGVTVKLYMLPNGILKTEDRHTDSMTISDYQQVLDILADYWSTHVWQARLRIWHFYLSLLVIIGLHIGIWWVNHGYGGFIMMLGACIILLTGAVDFLIGLLFGRSEGRALRECQDEVHLAMDCKATMEVSS